MAGLWPTSDTTTSSEKANLTTWSTTMSRACISLVLTMTTLTGVWWQKRLTFGHCRHQASWNATWDYNWTGIRWPSDFQVFQAGALDCFFKKKFGQCDKFYWSPTLLERTAINNSLPLLSETNMLPPTFFALHIKSTRLFRLNAH